MADQELRELATQRAHREARSRWILVAVISAWAACASAWHIITDDDYTHPMVSVLGVAAGVACLYFTGMVIRRWSKP